MQREWTKYILIPLVLSKIISNILVSNRFWIVLMLGQNEEICTPMMAIWAVLPDSITGQHHELVLLLEGVCHYLRERNNHLFLVALLFVPLVEVVTCWEIKQFLVSLVFNHQQKARPRSTELWIYLPRALERLRPPLTRPSAVTLPPAATILSRSGEFSGLWSSDRSTALPLRLSTHLESPTLATMICLSLIRVKMAVQPLSCPG